MYNRIIVLKLSRDGAYLRDRRAVELNHSRIFIFYQLRSSGKEITREGNDLAQRLFTALRASVNSVVVVTICFFDYNCNYCVIIAADRIPKAQQVMKLFKGLSYQNLFHNIPHNGIFLCIHMYKYLRSIHSLRGKWQDYAHRGSPKEIIPVVEANEKDE